MNTQQAPPLSSAEIAATLRSTNDSIARGTHRFLRERMHFEFFCECGDSHCHEGVWLTVAEYHVTRPGAVVAHPTL
jgi:hypothetical protein